MNQSIQHLTSALSLVINSLHASDLLVNLRDIGVSTGHGSENTDSTVIFYGYSENWKYEFLVYQDLSKIKVIITNINLLTSSQSVHNFFDNLENNNQHIAYSLGFTSNHKNFKHLEKLYKLPISKGDTPTSTVVSPVLDNICSDIKSIIQSSPNLDDIWNTYQA